MNAIVAFAAGMLLGFCKSREILQLLSEPALSAWGASSRFPLLSPLDRLETGIRIGLAFALASVSPTLWSRLVRPYFQKLDMFGRIFLVLSPAVLVSGVWFAWRWGVPKVYGFLANLEHESPAVAVKHYVQEIAPTLVLFCLALELPIVVACLARAGLVKAGDLLGAGHFFFVGALVMTSGFTDPSLRLVAMFALLTTSYAAAVLAARLTFRTSNPRAPGHRGWNRGSGV